MNSFLANIRGDKYLWAAIVLFSILSLLPVYSASSNLEYIVGQGTTTTHIMKHAAFLFIGLCIVYVLQFVDYKYFGAFAVLLLPVAIVALLATVIQGNTAGGVNAARWLRIPGIPFTIQTSTFATLVLLVYVARYLTKNRNEEITLQNAFLPLIVPILIVLALITPANGSTGLMLFVLLVTLLFIGGFPIKYIVGLGIVVLVLGAAFVYTSIEYKEQLQNTRVSTWVNRVDNFMNESGEEGYQVIRAKAAIVEGGQLGQGPGKSSFKQSLPQSVSDFIYAIIIEEYGLLGATGYLVLYVFILFRMVVISTKIHTFFGSILVFAAGLPFIFQAFLNMAVAVNLLPVTGQPLPIISYGGTSTLVTYTALGIIISVSCQIKSDEEIEKEKRNTSEAVIQDIA